MKKYFLLILTICVHISINSMNQQEQQPVRRSLRQSIRRTNSGGPIRNRDRNNNRNEPYNAHNITQRPTHEVRIRRLIIAPVNQLMQTPHEGTSSYEQDELPEQQADSDEEEDENEENPEAYQELAEIVRNIFQSPSVREYLEERAQELAEESEEEEEEPENIITHDQRKIELIRLIQEKHCHIQKLKDLQKPSNPKSLSFTTMLNLYKKTQQEKEHALTLLNIHQASVGELTKKYQELTHEHQKFEHLQKSSQVTQNICCICCETDTILMQIPCPMNHAEQICTTCYEKIPTVYNEEIEEECDACPLCRSELNH